ncbi:YfhJ family protein [Halalkalibacterium ligniniphilum]|uniref:YfhJ family protein n=1 Tax=Halalkalibacterium ligniniphilum TaxID=1134413 RepID=UPI00034949E3|nr:YfhJ family protein [Halalkalibacterium ligniniphilum]
MEERFERLANELLLLNKNLTYGQARTWVEGLWEDFEATRAKAGRTYQGLEMTEQIVRKWIKQYGPYLHKYSSEKEKFKHFNKHEHLKH